MSRGEQALVLPPNFAFLVEIALAEDIGSCDCKHRIGALKCERSRIDMKVDVERNGPDRYELRAPQKDARIESVADRSERSVVEIPQLSVAYPGIRQGVLILGERPPAYIT